MKRRNVRSSANRQHFQGYLAIERVLPGVIDDPHTAAPDLAAKCVIAECSELFVDWHIACADKVFEARE
jgi:hypothetical protein